MSEEIKLFGIATPKEVIRGVLAGDMDSFLKLLDLHQRANEADRARAFTAASGQSDQVDKLSEALAAAQGKFPPIDRKKSATVPIKDRETGKVKSEYTYKYADLADVISAVRGPLAEQGLAITQSLAIEAMPPSDKQQVLAVCTTHLRHCSGQWIRSVLKYPTSEKKIQELGSTFTYLRRYSLGAVLGIAPEEDDDAQLASKSEKKGGKSKEAGERNDAGDMPNEEQLAEFWSEWKALVATRFASKDEAAAWLKNVDSNPNKANMGKLRSILNRLKLVKPLEGKADLAPTGAGDKKPAKGKEQKTPEQKRREALQGRWRGLVVDKFKKFDAGKALEAACWWAGEYFSWVREPYTEMINGQLVVTRPKATLTAVEDVARAVDALAKLNEDQVDQIFDEWSHWREVAGGRPNDKGGDLDKIPEDLRIRQWPELSEVHH